MIAQALLPWQVGADVRMALGSVDILGRAVAWIVGLMLAWGLLGVFLVRLQDGTLWVYLKGTWKAKRPAFTAIGMGVMLVLSGVAKLLVPGDRDNCFTWGIGQQLERGLEGVVSKSRYGWWWHAGVINETRTAVEEFYPTAPKRKRLIPPLIFKGRPSSRPFP